ncbi:NINE protein [Corynebacterium poyangense]|uniref:NINE protein n=1 Tax=Corynebacterium poyangense TaxID=2684405 RepID=A0A7H0SNN1_9CORY|nr:TM2 domain-containing protein [Corynebacterium poyangense]MBZ8177190.1 NINE protein [Corynebacterium poyangense]QNQ90156.1 NINE protein [Corynebacterium poyangense]
MDSFDKDGLPIKPRKGNWENTQEQIFAKHPGADVGAFNVQDVGAQSYRPSITQPSAPEPVSQPVDSGLQAHRPPKNKALAACLALFLGTTGAHNFYLGNYRRGVAQLTFLGLSSFLAGVPGFLLVVWAIIEFVLILADVGAYNTRGHQ